MINYHTDHIPKNTPSNRRPGHLLLPQSITIHNTGNPVSTAKNERAWLTNASNTRTASYHLVVDEHGVIECLPLNENGWHAGDGSGETSGNRTSIGIEICESGDYSKSLSNAAELAAKLLKQYGWGVDRLRRHYDWSGKICPRLMYDDGKWTGWHAFKNKVAEMIQPPPPPPTTTLPDNRKSDLILSDGEQKLLVATLTEFTDQKLLEDSKWKQKAEHGSLTLSELAWLNTIILSRK
ncbi:peptidoglycan recognition protein family protein [Paenibacillus sp. FJAT-27812]|uniref:peptidoglycan recognition protein family protein n=1 Tax=Paenibacillus sp. FJAT-27812 TaxID=1684143 RepID=UPI0009EB6C46|nr:N-acetylmuramoyl-L-alanine amidase [Paenibacillus sp. FJAT-27812]